jgi:hypothetical protein
MVRSFSYYKLTVIKSFSVTIASNTDLLPMSLRGLAVRISENQEEAPAFGVGMTGAGTNPPTFHLLSWLNHERRCASNLAPNANAQMYHVRH